MVSQFDDLDNACNHDEGDVDDAVVAMKTMTLMITRTIIMVMLIMTISGKDMIRSWLTMKLR